MTHFHCEENQPRSDQPSNVAKRAMFLVTISLRTFISEAVILLFTAAVHFPLAHSPLMAFFVEYTPPRKNVNNESKIENT